MRRFCLTGLCLLCCALFAGASAGEIFADLEAVLHEGGPAVRIVAGVASNACEEGGLSCAVTVTDADGARLARLPYTLETPDSVMAGRHIRLMDINADGYMDIEAFVAGGASNRFCRYFVNDRQGGFIEGGPLRHVPNARVYPAQKLFAAAEQEGAAAGTFTLYRWGEDGLAPTVFRQAQTGEDDGGQLCAQVCQWEADGRETLLMRRCIAADAGAAALSGLEAQRDAALWQGLDASEAYLE